jgi:hypothetical protein
MKPDENERNFDMEAYYDSMRRILQLADTGIEALEYFLARAGEAASADAGFQCAGSLPLYLLPELAQAYLSVEDAFAVFSRQLPQNRIDEASAVLAVELSAAGLALADGNIPFVVFLVENNLLPAYRSWRKELAGCFNPFILC